MEHKWDVSIKEARRIQDDLREKIKNVPLKDPIRFIGGADVSFNNFEKEVYAGVIVLSYPDLSVVDYSCAKVEVDFPYVPGFLSFREIPPLVQAWNGLKKIPDVVMVDGHGIAHPRRLGIAAHFGLVTGVPTIGIAKNILYGSYEDPGKSAGDFTYISDPKTKENIGAVLRSKNNVRQVYISPGHMCDIPSALKVVLYTTRGYRLPEPTRLAHNMVNLFRTGKLENKG